MKISRRAFICQSFVIVQLVCCQLGIYYLFVVSKRYKIGIFKEFSLNSSPISSTLLQMTAENPINLQLNSCEDCGNFSVIPSGILIIHAMEFCVFIVIHFVGGVGEREPSRGYLFYEQGVTKKKRSTRANCNKGTSHFFVSLQSSTRECVVIY